MGREGRDEKGREMDEKGEGGNGRGKQGRERGGKARFGYLSRSPRVPSYASEEARQTAAPKCHTTKTENGKNLKIGVESKQPPELPVTSHPGVKSVI